MGLKSHCTGYDRRTVCGFRGVERQVHRSAFEKTPKSEQCKSCLRVLQEIDLFDQDLANRSQSTVVRCQVSLEMLGVDVIPEGQVPRSQELHFIEREFKRVLQCAKYTVKTKIKIHTSRMKRPDGTESA